MSQDPNNPSGKPPCRREDAQAVLLRLRDAGHFAYFAGGGGRGLLLRIEPNDWDVATDAPPDRVRQLFRNTRAVGAKFGVILVRRAQARLKSPRSALIWNIKTAGILLRCALPLRKKMQSAGISRSMDC